MSYPAEHRPRVLLVLVFSLIFAGGLAGCRPPSTIEIGFVAELSGGSSQLGVSVRDALTVAIDQINDSGGVHGSLLRLISYDDHGDLGDSRQAVQSLVDAGVIVMAGPLLSAMTQVSDQFDLSDILFVSPSATTSRLSGIDDNFIRILPISTGQGDALVAEMVKDQVRTAVIAYSGSNAAYSYELAKYIEAMSTGEDIEIVGLIDFDSMDQYSFSVAVESLEVDAVVLIVNGFDGAAIAQGIRKRGSTVLLFCSHWTATTEFAQLGGRAVEGARVVHIPTPDPSLPTYSEFASEFIRRYGEAPDSFAIRGYEALQVIREGLMLTDERSPAALKAAILSHREYREYRANLKIDRYGDAQRDYEILIVRDGQYVAR